MANISSIKLPSGISYNLKAGTIPYGAVDSTSTATVFTATVPGINELVDGTVVMLHNGVVTSASGFTININGLGAKKCYNNMTNATQDTTIFNVSYTMLFVYSSALDGGKGGWWCYRGYDANTNTIGYQLRGNYGSMVVSDTARYYKLYFTSADGKKWVPASVNSTNNATSARPVNQRAIDPFGRIVYTSANTNYTADSYLAAASAWEQYNITLGYSFNRIGSALTLTANTPVYVKCTPQTNGSAIMDSSTPIVQSLPTQNDGFIYIFLGIAYDATHIELFIDHPVYYHDGSGIRLWTGKAIPSVPAWALASTKPSYTASEISLTDGSTTETQMLENVQDELTVLHNVVDGGIFLTEETDPTVPSWAKQSSKPTYTASEVGALSTTAARVISIGSSTTAQSLSIRYKTEGSSGSTSTTVSVLGVSDITAGNTAGTIEVTKCTGDSAFSTGTITIPGIPTTAADVGAIPTTAKGSANGVAPLDSNSLIPESYLPSYVSDVWIEETMADFPTEGEDDNIYVAADTNKTYRWGGSTVGYVEISASLALGKTSSTAAPGNHTHSVSITPSTTSVYSITSLGMANTPTQIDTTKFSGGSLTMAINGTDSSQLDITFTAAAPQSGFYTAGTAATMPTRSQVTGLWNGYTSATAQAIQ